MEKAWIDFKTDEETFKTIMSHEEEFVYDMMRKKYGKDFDGINVKNSIKRNEIYKYNLAEYLVKLDVSCAEKIKAKGKNPIGFFSNNVNLMIRKLCLVYGLNPSDMDSIIASISSEYRDIFVCAFGINRKKVKMSVIVSTFNINTDDIYMKLMAAIDEIEQLVKTSKSTTKENPETEQNVPSPKEETPNVLNVVSKSEEVTERLDKDETLNTEKDQEEYQIETPEPVSEENATNAEFTPKKRECALNKFQTLNDYYESRGFSQEATESLYSKLTIRGKVYFDKYIEVVKNEEGTHIFKLKTPIPDEDEKAINYFTKSSIIALKHNQNNKEISIEPNTTEPEIENDNILDMDVIDGMADYLRILKNSNIITRELIINLQLPKKYEYFLLTEFDTNGKNEFSLEEEAEFLNMSVGDLCKHLIESMEYLKTQLNDKLAIDIDRVEILLNNSMLSEDGETTIKKTLN